MRIAHLLAAQVFLFSSTVYAVPYTFHAGDPASAAQVNANFKSLEDRLTTYDYRDFGTASNITQKVFSTDDIRCGQTEVRNIARTDAGGGVTNVKVTRIRYAGDINSARCQTFVFYYQNTATARLMLKREQMNDPGDTLDTTDELEPAAVMRSSQMIRGMTFGSASEISTTPNGQSAVPGGMFMDNRVAMGLADVTVPLNGGTTYTGCLKISSTRSSSTFITYIMRYSWYCAGAGEVKRIETLYDSASKSGFSTKTWLLESITTTP